MKETGGVLVIFGGLVLLIAGMNGTLVNVWHALLKQGTAPSSTPSTPPNVSMRPGPVGTVGGGGGPRGPGNINVPGSMIASG